MTTSAALDGVRFHPRIPHYNSGRVVPTYSIKFQRYVDLCKVLGVTCTEDLTDTLINIKKEKRNNSPILIRLLGCLMIFQTRMMALCFWPLDTAVTHRNQISITPWMCRKSQVWDPVEGSFAEPLTTTPIASEIMALCKGDDSASASSTDSVHMEGKDSEMDANISSNREGFRGW
jgi:hypothetical protein